MDWRTLPLGVIEEKTRNWHLVRSENQCVLGDDLVRD